jgi:translation initiation factor IF-3
MFCFRGLLCCKFSFFSNFWRCLVISGKQQDTLLNEQIREKEVRVISATGEQLGIMTSAKALEMAIQEDLDLVMISPQAKPPVCKIMNYGKYRFERAKKEKESKGKQTVVNIKEIRLSPTTDEHDLMTKVNQTIKFLEKKDKVKVTVRFRGREVAYAKAGEMMLDKFAQAIAEHGVIDKKAKLEGKNMSMFVSPKN